eukprot:3209432-Pyramimonas_sp.AAC.1
MDKAEVDPRKDEQDLGKRVKANEPAGDEQHGVQLEGDEEGGVVVVRRAHEGIADHDDDQHVVHRNISGRLDHPRALRGDPREVQRHVGQERVRQGVVQRLGPRRSELLPTPPPLPQAREAQREQHHHVEVVVHRRLARRHPHSPPYRARGCPPLSTCLLLPFTGIRGGHPPLLDIHKATPAHFLCIA